jgi:hypothetical protein
LRQVARSPQALHGEAESRLGHSVTIPHALHKAADAALLRGAAPRRAQAAFRPKRQRPLR